MYGLQVDLPLKDYYQTILVLVNGGFTQWTEWSACSESCGPKAVRMRMRLCTNPPPAFGGNDCAGWRFEVEYCKPKECPHKPGKYLRVA